MEAFLPLVFCPDSALVEFPVLVFPFSLFGGDFPGLVFTFGHNSMEFKKNALMHLFLCCLKGPHGYLAFSATGQPFKH